MLTRVAPRETAAPSRLMLAGPGPPDLNLLGGGQPKSDDGSGRILDEFDERPVRGARMEEGDGPPVGPGPRRAVHELEPLPLEPRELGPDVLHAEREVVEPLAALLEEATQGGIPVERGDELDERAS